MIETFPLLFASTMVVTGPLHPISFFPFFLITMVVAILLVPLYIASDGAMTRTGISKQEAAWAALLGMLAAMTFELLYLLPLTCLVMIVARGMLSGLSSRAILHSTAFSRFIAFCAGFLLVFVPSRIFIAVECAQNDCYENSELVVSGLSLKQWLGRASSGLPWDSWLLVLRGDISAALSPRGLLGALSDAWLFLVAVALVLYAIRAGRRLVARENPRTPKEPQRRLGLTVIALGLIFSSMSSLMVSLSQGLQRWNEIGLGLNQWRDTLLVQVGWAFILYGLLIFISSFLHGRSSPTDRSRIWIGSAAAIALLGMAMFTLIANDRYALRRRSEPVSNIVNLISTATVEFDDTDAGQAIRCELLSSYEQLTCKDCWHSGTRLTEELNNLSRSKHGSDFCPTSIRDAESVPPSGGAAG